MQFDVEAIFFDNGGVLVDSPTWSQQPGASSPKNSICRSKFSWAN
jgi:hypothetical protein